jgi:hypothetical protein
MSSVFWTSAESVVRERAERAAIFWEGFVGFPGSIGKNVEWGYEMAAQQRGRKSNEGRLNGR